MASSPVDSPSLARSCEGTPRWCVVRDCLASSRLLPVLSARQCQRGNAAPCQICLRSTASEEAGRQRSRIGGGSANSSTDDVPMPAAAGGATSSEAAPQGSTLNTQSPAVGQRSTEQNARKRKSGAKRRNERKQRERVAGAGAAETSSTGSGSQEGSPESGGAASSKAAHNGATSKHTAPVLQSSSKQNAWQGGSRQWKQGQGSGTVPVVPKRAAATLRPRGPGPVYRYVGEGAPKGVPITASARAPLRAPAPVAARTSTVAPPASRVAGGAADSAAASQVTFLILSVISALQGLLVQNAGVGHGGEAGVVVEEGL